MKDMLEQTPLLHRAPYVDQYDKGLLFPLPRQVKRAEIGIGLPLPFLGYDRWTAYELSWLNPKGKPQVGIGVFWITCDSPCMVESKSFKLYLNSYNQTIFSSKSAVVATLGADVSE